MREIVIRHNAAQLKDLPDRLLHDIGLNRSNFELAVRYGHSDRSASWADWL
ncbi:DUF1127 domain-containing protein [Roseomonas sp. WA12]